MRSPQTYVGAPDSKSRCHQSETTRPSRSAEIHCVLFRGGPAPMPGQGKQNIMRAIKASQSEAHWSHQIRPSVWKGLHRGIRRPGF